MSSKTRLILHDLRPGDAAAVLPAQSEECLLFAAYPAVRYCVGCYGCWTKTPGKCVIRDRGADMAGMMPKCGEFIILSRLVFGGLSPDIKAVMDRSIGFVLPFFRIVKGEMHHVPRVEHPPDLRYVFYGADMTEREKETAKALAKANSINLASGRSEIQFFPTFRDCKEVLK
ncbi:MAG: flavodoxin family protein [Clostridiales bacterium]|jgi:multimeric flavodoxin WrbA|nr:flavodoxin family protein [Clostridiales bacterium]MDR2750236.1 flavodoxin family protein [Clostridiales bacterium]